MIATLSQLDKITFNGLVKMAEDAENLGALLWTSFGDSRDLTEIDSVGVGFVKIIKPSSLKKIIFFQIEEAQCPG
jgi:hypothetical protein